LIVFHNVGALKLLAVTGLSREFHSPTSQVSESPARLILGSGRSGTTWVLDCLAEANGLRPVFEPLHPRESDVAAVFAYGILEAVDAAPELEEYFAEIASGGVHSRWIDYRAPKGLVFPRPRQFSSVGSARRWFSNWRKYWKRRRKYSAATRRSHVLIKCIRANLMAPWFAGRLTYKTALTVRHPCSVVESQLRLGKVWDPTPVSTGYRENGHLHEVTNGRYLSLLNRDLTTVEALTLNWVIENQWPVEQSAEHGYAVVFYEDLLDDDGSSWQSLCDALALSKLPGKELLRKPSQQAASKSSFNSTSSKAPKWQKGLSADELSRIQRILDDTECNLYSTNSAGPIR
jgi:hypothetical protein